MEFSDKALILKSVDYKENDKLCRAFTMEHGLITVKLAGVKKPKAKLKFAAQPFAFYSARFLSVKGGFYTPLDIVTDESFYDLCLDLQKFTAANVCGEIADGAFADGEQCPIAFVELLKALKSILYDGDPYYSACVFILAVLKIIGFENDTANFGISANSGGNVIADALSLGYTRRTASEQSKTALKKLIGEFTRRTDRYIRSVKSIDMYD